MHTVDPLYNMDTLRFLMIFGLIAVAVCLTSAQKVATDKPNTYVEHSNGVDISIPGTTPARDVATPAQSVPNYLYNGGGSTVLQNGAGGIFTRPDGKTVLIGAGGQTLVTDGDSDSDEQDGDDSNSGSNVVINGQWIQSSNIHGTTLFNGYQVNLINGGLQVKIGDKVYNFPAKDASFKSKERVDINGQPATVEYDNGNIVLELADGTVFAKTEQGMFSGNRQSYENRDKIRQAAFDQAAKVQQQMAELQNRLEIQMQELRANLERTFSGNFPF